MGLALLCPLLLLLGVIFLPEPLAEYVLKISLSPASVLPFLENDNLMRTWTLCVFGRMTPNYAPIQILVLFIFWFLVALMAVLCVSWLISRAKNTGRG